MDRFFSLLREGKFKVKYDVEYTDKQFNIDMNNLHYSVICNHIIELNCSNNQLTELPDLPNVQILYCSSNQLTKLGRVPNVKELWCSHNQLIELPKLPNVEILYCYGNRINSLPDLHNIQKLYCQDNQLTKLPELFNIQELLCQYNHLFSTNLDDWKIIWKFKKSLICLYLVPRLFIRWKLTTIRHRLSIEHKEAIICHPKTYYVRELYNENN